jgi:hypothetical protein
MAKDVEDAPIGTLLRISCRVHAALDPGLHHRSSTHGARLECGVDGDAIETPATHDPRGATEHQHLGVRACIATPFHRVARRRNHHAVAHRNRTNRDFAAHTRGTRQRKRATQEALVGLDRQLYPTATSGSSTLRSGRSTTRMVSSTKRTRSNVMQLTGQWSSQILQLVQRS